MRDERSGHAAPERSEAEAQPAAGPSRYPAAHPAEAGSATAQATTGYAMMPWRGRALLLIVLLDCLLTAFAL